MLRGASIPSCNRRCQTDATARRGRTTFDEASGQLQTQLFPNVECTTALQRIHPRFLGSALKSNDPALFVYEPITRLSFAIRALCQPVAAGYFLMDRLVILSSQCSLSTPQYILLKVVTSLKFGVSALQTALGYSTVVML